jgi:hypothetical protein
MLLNHHYDIFGCFRKTCSGRQPNRPSSVVDKNQSSQNQLTRYFIKIFYKTNALKLLPDFWSLCSDKITKSLQLSVTGAVKAESLSPYVVETGIIAPLT